VPLRSLESIKLESIKLESIVVREPIVASVLCCLNVLGVH
jgi:hypothetical protein